MAKTSGSIAQMVTSGKHATTTLRTDDRVLARITDGIYRQPASAIRELIFNAYDADARNVWIQTDWPRFSQIVIDDDGRGMTIEVLDHLIHHIGGSPKRTQIGKDLKITDPKDPKYSPSGRQLIGKIGIGLFAVAQLTRHFQIITKPEKSKHRYIADVHLKTFSEDQLERIAPNSSTKFETGDVEIWQESAADDNTHGTRIVLLDLKDHSRALLQSRDRWLRIINNDQGNVVGELIRKPPKFHIGSVDPATQDIIRDSARLPWSEDKNSPKEKFQNLYQAILDQFAATNSDPTLEATFDNYLTMLWTLSLACPVEYIDKHPFDLTGRDGVRFFMLSNHDKQSATEVEVS